MLRECWPQNVEWNEFLKDCEKAVNISDLHSDEWSTEDETLAQEEKDAGKRPERISTNSIIKIHSKPWRSTRVCEVQIT